MGLSSVQEARRLDLAERVACRHGLIVVPGFIGALIDRLETEPGTITPAELEAIRYAIATATVDEPGGGIKSLEGSGGADRRGWFSRKNAAPVRPTPKRPSMASRLKAPDHLRPATQKFWLETKAKYEMEQHHDHLFMLACEALDRAAQAREILAAEGVTVRDDRQNMRPHPMLTVERDCRIAVARLFRELDLDADVPAAGNRPPALRRNRRE